MIITLRTIPAKTGVGGYVISIRNFEETEKSQHKLRNSITGSNNIARYNFDDIKGNSSAIKNAIATAKRFALVDSSVIIGGNSGTGKELFAQSIHNASRRKDYNFVAINCAAIPENLLESELFGYEDGAFTGAKKGGNIGYFELAHKGTLFLDEIAEMPLNLQGKLLRALEERRIYRIGAHNPIDVDVRVISATNKNLKKLVQEGMFREDLYYRLNVLPVNLPNLADRENDVLEIFELFRKQLNGAWSYDAITEKLRHHSWDGNIRELRNLVEYLDSLDKDSIELDDLPEHFNESQNIGGKDQELSKNDSVKPVQDSIMSQDKEVLQLLLSEGRNIEGFKHILQVLSDLNRAGASAGRETIGKKAAEEGLNYTESEIRSILQKLAQRNYIRILKGRGGSRLQPSGEELLNKLNTLLGE